MRGRLLALGLVAVAAAFVCASAARAAGTSTATTAPVFDGKGHLIKTPFVPHRAGASLTQARALLWLIPSVSAISLTLRSA